RLVLLLFLRVLFRSKASFTAVFTCVRAQLSFWGRGLRVVKMGKASREKIMIRLEVIITEEVCIATTWSCTKSFWFLRPTDELLSFRSDVLGDSPGVQPR
ncbi:hypothetical protein P7M41_25940, partial [Vibrio parahaemolyticus]|nr:hypothetical protein [Vibrio parahaemolyticus]